MLTLLVLQGPDKGRRFELPDAPAVLGRESRAIPLTDQTVSRRHAELQPDLANDGDWFLQGPGQRQRQLPERPTGRQAFGR